MQIQKVKLTECKTGDILAEAPTNIHGAIIVLEDTVLNEYIINKLIQTGIKSVKIYVCSKKGKSGKSNDVYLNIKKNYRAGILSVKSIITDIARGEPLDKNEIDKIIDIVCSGMTNVDYVLKIIDRERNYDEETYIHSLNVAFYAMLLGNWLNYDNKNIRKFVKAGLLHDIGKIKIPIEILNKESSLTESEFELIKKHTFYGYQMAKSSGCISEGVCDAILLHHEREDKSGYPLGIGGDRINTTSKITAIADVYDAMTSDRVYRKKWTPFEVFEMFETIGVSKFDYGLTKVFSSKLSTYFIGTKVLLNTKEIGEIVYIPPYGITDPIIKIGDDYIDLVQEKDIYISSIFT